MTLCCRFYLAVDVVLLEAIFQRYFIWLFYSVHYFLVTSLLLFKSLSPGDICLIWLLSGHNCKICALCTLRDARTVA